MHKLSFCSPKPPKCIIPEGERPSGDNISCAYDASGNPTSYYNGTRWTFGWENGRSLISATDGETEISYVYDKDDLRTSKTVDGVVHNYIYASGKLLRETYGSNVLDFFYDENGAPYAMKYNGVLYYYVTNLQGDVIRLVDVNGTTKATYSYGAYGSTSASNNLANVNPLRYRSYYYDSETGFYYLQSRYYDPSIGRFINADGYTSTGQGILGYNMFTYCLNNPVVLCDSNGLRAVINTQGMDSFNKKNPIYYSDGNGKSDDLLEYCKSMSDELSASENFELKVYHQGTQPKNTDHSLDCANFILFSVGTFFVSSISKPISILLEIGSLADFFLNINDTPIFPDGNYDTYKVTTSWTDTYEWDGGTTYTFYSYEFTVCWDTVSTYPPTWRISESRNNSYCETVYN